jgi:hypothetical protein
VRTRNRFSDRARHGSENASFYNVVGNFWRRGGIRTPGTSVSSYNGLANSRFHTLLFGIHGLPSDELPHCWAKSPCSGAFVQLLCNRYSALNTKKLITITKAFRPACSTLLLRKARFFVQVVCTNLLGVHAQGAALV